MDKVLFSSKKHDWETPQDLFDELNKEFRFYIDVCADRKNTKCMKYFDIEQNGLIQKWGGQCWCNPPYNREIIKWVSKADKETQNGVITVMLLPARTDTKWFHEFIYKKYEVRFLKGRLKFKGAQNSAPFPSMIVIFKKGKN